MFTRRATPRRSTGPSTGTGDGRERAAGFTLIELLIVVALIGILASLAVPQLRDAPKRAKEAVLKRDLLVFREIIDQYYADKGQYPTELEALVEEGYLRAIPVDPITGSTETWEVEYAEIGDDIEEEEEPGIIDVHSGSDGVALDGTYYADW